MDIVLAIRKLCEGETGFRDLFDKAKTYDRLCALVDDETDAKLFAKLFYGKAREALLELINDAYNWEVHGAKVTQLLMADGLDVFTAKRALAAFYRAFGFPGYREMDESKISTVSDDLGGGFTVEYEGEVENGKEYGVGVRTSYSHGKWCYYDECVWINGVMNGFFSGKDMEFGMFELHKTGFVVNDREVGRTKCVCGEDDYYDDGTKFSVK